MRHFKYILRLGPPALVLGILTGYADFLAKDGRVPLPIILALTVGLGFLVPKGRWRWAILVGAGVHLANISGHLLDSTAIPEMHRPTLERLARDLIPALIGTYCGIFAHRWFFEGDTWLPRGSHLPQDTALLELEASAAALVERKPSEEKKPPAVPRVPPSAAPIKPLIAHPAPAPAKTAVARSPERPAPKPAMTLKSPTDKEIIHGALAPEVLERGLRALISLEQRVGLLRRSSPPAPASRQDLTAKDM